MRLMLKFILISVIFAISYVEGYAPDESTREKLKSESFILTDELLIVYIEDNLMTFSGTYYFNSTFSKDVIAKVVFPFYIDKNHPFPINIKVNGILPITTKEEKIFKILKDSIEYKAYFKTNKETKLKVEYKQILKEPKAVYLFTANDLKIPVKSLKVYIYVPDKYKEVKISYRYKSTKKLKNYIMYKIDEKNIIPKGNLIIEWKK